MTIKEWLAAQLPETVTYAGAVLRKFREQMAQHIKSVDEVDAAINEQLEAGNLAYRAALVLALFAKPRIEQRAAAVVNITTGEEFPSVQAAADAMGQTRHAVFQVLRKGREAGVFKDPCVLSRVWERDTTKLIIQYGNLSVVIPRQYLPQLHGVRTLNEFVMRLGDIVGGM